MGEIDKTVTATTTVTVNIKWILSDTEPTPPEGYTRTPELDIDLGQLGKLWAYTATP